MSLQVKAIIFQKSIENLLGSKWEKWEKVRKKLHSFTPFHISYSGHAVFTLPKISEFHKNSTLLEHTLHVHNLKSAELQLCEDQDGSTKHNETKFRYLGYFWVSPGLGVSKFNGDRCLFKL